MTHDSPVIRMRCADAAEKVTAHTPQFLRPYKTRLIRLAATARQQEVRWHLAQPLSRLQLNRQQRLHVVAILGNYLTDKSSIVKTFAMQALADVAAGDAQLWPGVRAIIARLTRSGTPAMRSRGRTLLRALQ